MSKVIRTGTVAGSGVVTLGRAEGDLFYDPKAPREKAPSLDLDGMMSKRLKALTDGLDRDWETKLREEHETTRSAGERQLADEQQRHQEEVTKIHQERYDEGHADGVALREAEAEEAVQRMAVLHEALRHDRDQVLLEAETLVVDLAVALARRVTRVQAELDVKQVARTMREALKHLSERSNLVIKVHAEDLQIARRFAAAWTERVQQDAVLKIQVSDHVDRGGCMIEGGEENVDARLESQLDILQQTLREQVEETFESPDASEETGSTPVDAEPLAETSVADEDAGADSASDGDSGDEPEVTL